MVLEQKKVQTDGIELEFLLQKSCFVEICLFDEIGQLVYNFCDHVEPGYHDHYVPTKGLSGGTYLLRVAENGDTDTHEMLSLE